MKVRRPDLDLWGFFLELHQAEACRILQRAAARRLDFSRAPFLPPPPSPPIQRATVFKGPVTSELVIWHTAVAGRWGLIGLHCSGGFSSNWIQALSFNLDPTNLQLLF